MKTILELLTLSTEFLKNKKIPSPRRSAEDIIADALGLERVDLYLKYDQPIQEAEVEKVRSQLRRRSQNEPWQYIRGFVEFYGCKIKVTPAVLIPRPETEILVDLIAKELALTELAGKTLLDLCTGSGCIGLALKKRFPDLMVTLADISKEALEVVDENAKLNELKVTLAEGDFLNAVSGSQFDYIVCNPPYISAKEYENLDLCVKSFEPKLALYGGESGLEFYTRLAREAGSYLKPQGKLFLEIGYDQGDALFRLFSQTSFKQLTLNKDWAGHDRFFSLENE